MAGARAEISPAAGIRLGTETHHALRLKPDHPIGAGQYAKAKWAAKLRKQYGHGSQEGLIAAETGNNAVVPASMIPALTLVLPGSAAVLMAAMFLQGVRPGPLLLVMNPGFFYQIVAILLTAKIANLLIGLLLKRVFMQLMTIPSERLMAVIAILCVVCSFVITQRMFKVYVTVLFGFPGFLLRELRFPMVPSSLVSCWEIRSM
ncbi:tripartite tricarboxylate transporter permease [Palleronia sp. LCG004]|uniref:tripartite tricarboxylate transporter permease n=1 Tax=Palleronia sp. LCG004 TaxID=3079304 RepID=UPI002942686A|nr:tripartite tricarboxylate transporter permease [Palleronia sp. LCG004]WOI57564.1 tripartite tricarboxylate transporter permease [Palleronia sp. LCG004]